MANLSFEDGFLVYIFCVSNFLNFRNYGFCWCSQNALQLEEKEKREKELRIKIIEEAEEYKIGFCEKRKLSVESNKVNNREREKVQFSLPFLASMFLFFSSSGLKVKDLCVCGAVILCKSGEVS